MYFSTPSTKILIVPCGSDSVYQSSAWNNSDFSTIQGSLAIIGDTTIATTCLGNPYNWNDGNSYNASGTYTDTIQTTNGCDSIITLILTVNSADNTNITATITEGETYSFDSQTLTEAGTYTDTLQNINGCDSIVTLILTVNPASDLINITDNFKINLYPNPTLCDVNLQIEGLQGEAKIVLCDVQSKIISEKVIFADGNNKIETSNLPCGVYYVRVIYKDKVLLQKIIRR